MSRSVPSHVLPPYASRLKITLMIAILITIVELVGGFLSNSLSLMSDAGHVFADVVAIFVTLTTMRMAVRPHTKSLTYGYHRAEIMAAMVNGITLIVVSAFIIYEAYRRFLQPPVVQTPILIPIAAIGLIANTGMIILLKKASQQSLNIKGAFLHVLSDTLSSFGVLVGGFIIALTRYYIIDPIVGVLIGILILKSALILARDSVNILLEGVPKHLSVTEIAQTIKEPAGVKGVHDLHIWAITSGLYALSAHVVVEDQSVKDASEIVKGLQDKLKERFNINHITIQMEPEKKVETREE